MLEVKIGDEVVDAGDFQALRAACHKSVSATTASNLDRDEAVDLLISMTSLVFATAVALGGLLMVRSQSGLRDSALEYLREELEHATGSGEVPADELQVIVP